MSKGPALTWDGYVCSGTALTTTTDNVMCVQAVLDSNDLLTKRQAYELMTTNLEKILDIEGYVGDMGELVAYEGGSALEFTSKPVAIVSPARGFVEVV